MVGFLVAKNVLYLSKKDVPVKERDDLILIRVSIKTANFHRWKATGIIRMSKLPVTTSMVFGT